MEKNIIENEQQKNAESVFPSEFINRSLGALPERSRDILIKRFDLDGKGKKTLEEIGKAFSITRERVRQIESAMIEKIKADNAGEIDELSRIFKEIIIQSGGVMEREFFLIKAREYFNKFVLEEKRNKQEKQHIILALRLAGGISQEGANDKFKDYLYADRLSLKLAEDIANESKNIFVKEERIMAVSDLFIRIMRLEFLAGKNISEEILNSYLHLSPSLAQNPFGEWGLIEWPLITPKSVKDKAYLVMLHEKKPLHFKEIAALIARAWKKKKPVLPETAHNELIKNRQFVLIGRGIYALAEWGYERGSVRDIIKTVLAKTGQEMNQEEITKEVMLQRLVKPGTVALNLKDENVFERTAEGLYKLKTKN